MGQASLLLFCRGVSQGFFLPAQNIRITFAGFSTQEVSLSASKPKDDRAQVQTGCALLR
jgi:hypothetical protein